MKTKMQVARVLLMLSSGVVGCGDAYSPSAPSRVAQPGAVQPAPAPPVGATTLRGVSLSGVVYELTSTGRRPIPQATVYCEACSEQTHMFATADENGFYHFSGDLASGGGVWVTPGVPTAILVGPYNKDYEDPPGLPASPLGPGWREVLIDGDTRFDIELVRRSPRGISSLATSGATRPGREDNAVARLPRTGGTGR